MQKDIRIIILAGGKGTRMKGEVPKVLVQLNAKPMIKYVLESISKSGIDENPVVVVGHRREEIMQELGDKYNYAIQEEQLGTGHAIMIAESLLKNKSKNVMVLPSDHPFITTETIQKLANKHLESGAKITMATVKLPDFKDWRNVFYNSFSRIIRNEKNEITKDVQFRDTNDEEKKVTEINQIFFCFNANWLWKNLKKLQTNNDQKQYYQTDLIQIAMNQGEKIESIDIEPTEALAANSNEEFEVLKKFVPEI